MFFELLCPGASLTGSLLRKPITHIHLFEKSINILISTGSGWGARRLIIGLNLHHQALLLLCVCKCEKRRLRRNAFLMTPVCSFVARICNWYDCISMGLITIVS